MDFQLVGQSFHLPGTRIYRNADGSLSYVCPRCAEHPVPRHLELLLAPFATERRA
jgi:hypothetical protein